MRYDDTGVIGQHYHLGKSSNLQGKDH